MKILNKDINTLRILELVQYITLISILVLIIMYYSLGCIFETLKTMIFVFFLFVPNLKSKIKRETSYKELRNSICLMLIIVWQLLLFDIYLTLERLYREDFGVFYVATIVPMGALILFIIFSEEWKEIVYPVVRFLKLISLLCKE